MKLVKKTIIMTCLCNQNGECLLRGTNWVYIIQVNPGLPGINVCTCIMRETCHFRYNACQKPKDL